MNYLEVIEPQQIIERSYDLLSLTAEEVANLATQFALSKKAEDIVTLDLRLLTTMADFFVICTGLSDTHIRSIAEGIRRGLRKKYGMHVWHVEGESRASWILLDYVDIVVHIFQQDARDFYALERLWGDASRKEFSELDFDEEAVLLLENDEINE